MGGSPSASRRPPLSFWLLLGLIGGALVTVVFVVDLTPRVESDFFFSTEDPALRATLEIERRFPSREQLLVTASAGDIGAPGYVERIGALTVELAALPGVGDVNSLTAGPAAPAAVAGSPVWSRLLLGDDPRLTYLVLWLEGEGDGELVAAVEEVLSTHDDPDFELEISGVPYVVELIRRHLWRDLRVFSTAAFLVFGLVILVVYRSLPLVAGTLFACVSACLLALTALHLLAVPIGVLTANLATIVFVLTLSHTVFLTANWRRVRVGLESETAVKEGVRVTFVASFWCMVAALLGFGSLLLASAKPLRELGISGVVGTMVAIIVAYGIFPVFLGWAESASLAPPRSPAPGKAAHPGATGTITVAAVTLLAAFGLGRLDTDPSLLSYFAAGSDIRTGLERVDRSGGSSPLTIVVADPVGERLDSEAGLASLGRIQEGYDGEPAVGVSLSLPVLVAEARQVPFVALFSGEQIVDLLDTDRYDQIARSFLSADRREALFFLRMREAGRSEPRRQVVERLSATASEEGLEVRAVGGLYDLQGKLGELVASSLGRELGGLLFFFVFVATAVSRSPRIALAMVACLAVVPVFLLGGVGHLRLPVDVISAPAANVAIALGIDAMIHLVMAVRRRRRAGDSERRAWVVAAAQMRPAIVGAMSILAAGFGIFVLSSFPPTRRFGSIVAVGSLASAVVALVVLPYLAQAAGRVRERIATWRSEAS